MFSTAPSTPSPAIALLPALLPSPQNSPELRTMPHADRRAPGSTPPDDGSEQLAPVTPLREGARTVAGVADAEKGGDGPGAGLAPDAQDESGTGDESAAEKEPGADDRPAPRPRRSLNPWQAVGVVAFDSSTSDDRPPPDVRTIQKLALYAFEVLEGARSAAQLGPWLLPDAAAQLDERRARRVERRTLCKDRRRVLATPGPAHIDRPAPNVVEATVVLHADPRSTPVALRFEYLGRRWRITDLTVL